MRLVPTGGSSSVFATDLSGAGGIYTMGFSRAGAIHTPDSCAWRTAHWNVLFSLTRARSDVSFVTPPMSWRPVGASLCLSLIHPDRPVTDPIWYAQYLVSPQRCARTEQADNLTLTAEMVSTAGHQLYRTVYNLPNLMNPADRSPANSLP